MDYFLVTWATLRTGSENQAQFWSPCGKVMSWADPPSAHNPTAHLSIASLLANHLASKKNTLRHGAFPEAYFRAHVKVILYIYYIYIHIIYILYIYIIYIYIIIIVIASFWGSLYPNLLPSHSVSLAHLVPPKTSFGIDYEMRLH